MWTSCIMSDPNRVSLRIACWTVLLPAASEASQQRLTQQRQQPSYQVMKRAKQTPLHEHIARTFMRAPRVPRWVSLSRGSRRSLRPSIHEHKRSHRKRYSVAAFSRQLSQSLRTAALRASCGGRPHRILKNHTGFTRTLCELQHHSTSTLTVRGSPIAR